MADKGMREEQGLRPRAEERVTPATLTEVEQLRPQEIQALLHDLQVHQVELEMQNEELRYTQSVLSASRDKYSRLYDFAPVAYCTLDERAVILECNLTMAQLLGHTRNKLIRYPLSRFVVQEDVSIFHYLLKQDKRENVQELHLQKAGDEPVYVQMRLHRLETVIMDDDRAEWLVTISDITRLHEITMELQVKSRAIETTMEGVVITDSSNVIRYVNPAFEETTGYKKEAVLGKSPSMLQSGRHTPSFYSDMWRDLHETGKWRGEIWNRRASGDLYPEWLSISTIFDDRKRPLYYVGVFSDITREEEVRKRLHQLAYLDSVTGLPNRHLFMDRLEQEIMHARRDGSSFALLFMDLDRFKGINDTLGHSVGDQLLYGVGQRLHSLLRENDTIARMGGDEFIVLLPMVDSALDANMVAQKILASMAEPFELERRQYHMSLSIGISRYPDDGRDAETLIKRADIAMYKAKESGRNTFHLFSENLDENLNKQFDLANDLRQAFDNARLTLAYQPLMDLESGRYTGVEALLRWQHPKLGNVSPSEFIPLAEETGQIVKIGYWVLRTAANQYQAWSESGIDVGVVTVNLSPHQFLQTDLVDQIRDILSLTGMPAEKLGIEITESAAMPNFEYSIKTLEALREMGISIYIDDFGSGFSSLSHLRHLPIDVLKIDRQFIDEIPENPDDVAIATAIIAMAKSLNLHIVAEGVENQQQLAFLRDQGCQSVQGYLFAKPMSAERIASLRTMGGSRARSSE